MAFLHHSPNRPACVVSALPKRFRDSLARNLAGSVAISTCAVAELELVVRQRGATMAVIGVDETSVDAAERLSHECRDVKVFLAHYKDREQPSEPMNGFAGIFDVRLEPDRLAATIQRNIASVTSQVLLPTPSQVTAPRILSSFIEMQKHLSNDGLFFHLLLKNFVEITQAREGVVFLNAGESPNQFKVVAQVGATEQILGCSAEMAPDCLRTLAEERIFQSEQHSVCDVHGTSSPLDFFVAIPLVVNCSLIGSIALDRIKHGSGLGKLLEAAWALLEQRTEVERTTRRDKMIGEARRTLDVSWLVSGEHGRILHQEGREASWFSEKRDLREARLRDLVAKARRGAAGSTKIRGRTVSYRPLRTDYGIQCVLVLEPLDKAFGSEINDHSVSLDRLASALKKNLPSREQMSLIDIIISDISTNADALDAKALTSLGLSLDAEGAPRRLVAQSALVLLATKCETSLELKGTITRERRLWFFTVESEELSLKDTLLEWDNLALVRGVIEALSLPKKSVVLGRFGFQLQLH